MLAEITQGELLGEIVLDELSRRLRDEHLTAVPCCGDAGAPVDIHSGIAFLGSQRLARVDAHSSSDRPGSESALPVSRSGDRFLRAGEGDKKRIALGIDFYPAGGR